MDPSCQATRWIVESSSLNLLGTFRDLFVYRDDSLTSKSFTMRAEQLTKCSVPFQKLRARFAVSLMLQYSDFQFIT